MKKIVAFSCILVLLAFFSVGTVTSMNDDIWGEQPSISATTAYDLTAPVVTLDLTEYDINGNITVLIVEVDTTIYNYTIDVNGTDLSGYIGLDTPNIKTFEFDANVVFEDTTDIHNYLFVWAFNSGGVPSPFPSINQGGGAGGGGGFLFCDDDFCWGRMPQQPVQAPKKFPGTDYSITDPTAPIPIVDVRNLVCCGNVSLYNYTENDFGASLDSSYIIYTDSGETVTYHAINDEGVSGTVKVTWYVSPPVTSSSYFALSSILFIALASIYQKRKKIKS